MKFWIITFSNMHWCGGEQHCLVMAETEHMAQMEASEYMEEVQRELFADEFEEEPDLVDESAVSVDKVEEFDENHDYFVYVSNKLQRDNFYPCVNFEFEDYFPR